MRAHNLFFCLFMLCLGTASAQYMWQVNKDTTITWYYQDGDEFNGNSLDREKWITGLPWGRTVVSQDMYFTDREDLEQGNGVLKFYLRKRDYKIKLSPWEIDSAYFKKNKITLNNDTFPFKYTAGLIWSKKKYKYGYFEMRFKCPKNGAGMWPAFWTFGGNKNDEIDFFEIKCEKNNYVHVDAHCPDGCSNYPTILGFHKDWGGWIKTDASFDDGYNTIAGEWKNGYVKWYLNGKGIAYFKGSFEAAMSVIANMSMAKDGGPFKPGPDETTVYPGIMEVDYIRIWSPEDPGQNSTLTALKGSDELKAPVPGPQGNNISMKKKKKFLYGKKSNYKNEGIFLSLLRDSKKSYLLTLQGNGPESVNVELKDSNNVVVFSKPQHSDEFLQIDMNKLPAGKYTFIVKYNNKTIQQEISYN